LAVPLMRREPAGRIPKASMTQFLASVRDTAEAEIVLAAGADIVDLKDPEQGALGAVAPDVIESCVAAGAGRVPVSATVGDLPMVPDTVTRAVAATDALGVDIVKLGVLPGGDPEACFAALRALNLRAGLILVFFADAMPAYDPVEAARSAGARGLMLDTAGKGDGALPDHMDMTAIALFVDAGRRAGLTTGVAGSLRTSHVAPLLDLCPDVMGFRGALCQDGIRNRRLDPEACRQIRALIPAPHAPKARFGESQAAALC
jgi:(5-formylfuran-3-yl)methyl phosphate synthase